MKLPDELYQKQMDREAELMAWLDEEQKAKLAADNLQHQPPSAHQAPVDWGLMSKLKAIYAGHKRGPKYTPPKKKRRKR